MNFNYRGRGFVVTVLSSMLVVLGVVNYQFSKQSLVETSAEFKAYEQAQLEKNKTQNTDKVDIVDSMENEVSDIVTQTSSEIKNEITSEVNMAKATYVIDMKMTREKQRSDLIENLNEMINNPSTSEETRTEASNMKLQVVKDQETELQIENLLSTKGFENALVYISSDSINIVTNQESLDKDDAAKIFDLVAEQTNIAYENIKLANNN